MDSKSEGWRFDSFSVRQIEDWSSGLWHLFAKQTVALQPPIGSNPISSAKNNMDSEAAGLVLRPALKTGF